jgi:hypothetical protein
MNHDIGPIFFIGTPERETEVLVCRRSLRKHPSNRPRTKKIHRDLEQDCIYYPLPVYQRLGFELSIEDSSVANGGQPALRHTLSHRFKIFQMMRLSHCSREGVQRTAGKPSE